MGENVFVTGEGGFIGTHLCERLKGLGYEVMTTYGDHSLLFDPRRLKDAIGGSKIVYHLASINNPKAPNIENVNVEATENLLKVIPKSSRLIYPSTFAVYDQPTSPDTTIDEFHLLNPRHQYGATKLKAEELITTSGVPYIILRLANVYGPGMPPYKHSVISTFFNLMQKGSDLTIDGDGSQTRDFVYVDDIVDGLISAISRGTNNIVNLCSGVAVTIKDLISLMSEVSGLMPNVTYRLADQTQLGYWCGDPAKAKQVLGWETKISLKEGLRKTWDEIQKQTN